MDIASLIVRARPESLGRVTEELLRLPGVEVAATGAGRLAVTVEDTAGTPVATTLLDIHRIEGVLSATLVYQYSDDIPETTEVTP